MGPLTVYLLGVCLSSYLKASVEQQNFSEKQNPVMAAQ